MNSFCRPCGPVRLFHAFEHYCFAVGVVYETLFVRVGLTLGDKRFENQRVSSSRKSKISERSRNTRFLFVDFGVGSGDVHPVPIGSAVDRQCLFVTATITWVRVLTQISEVLRTDPFGSLVGNSEERRPRPRAGSGTQTSDSGVKSSLSASTSAWKRCFSSCRCRCWTSSVSRSSYV